jgi:hypothetical protein
LSESANEPPILAFLVNEFLQREAGIKHKKEDHFILVYNLYLFKFGGYSTKYEGRTLLHGSQIIFPSICSPVENTIFIALEIHNIEPVYKYIADKANYKETYSLFPSV